MMTDLSLCQLCQGRGFLLPNGAGCLACGGSGTAHKHDLTVPQLDIFGGEQVLVLAPDPAPRATSTHEQPRLFEPQYEGQLEMSGDNPENGAGGAPER